MRVIIWSCLFLLTLFSCADDSQERSKNAKPISSIVFTPVEKPVFVADSAYQYIVEQLAFGPRVPGSKSHANAAVYLEKQFKKWNWQTNLQLGSAVTFNGKEIAIKNIVARFDTTKKSRVLLMAHWDTRPFADRDEIRKTEAIDGANDGASGVGVLLEIARIISSSDLKPNIGIDIVLFDAEDYGQPSGMMSGQTGDTWCLGSQYWAKHLAVDYVRPKYGILLDMVGAKDAIFPKEGVSMQYNPQLVNKIWYFANKLGYGKYFIDYVRPKYGILLDMVGAKDAIFSKEGVSMQYNPQLVNKIWYFANKLGYGKYFIQQEASGGITDDHLYVNKIAKIPSIDIIHYDPYQGDFGAFHHRHSDDINVIDKTTLEVVGNVVLETIYREK